MILYWAFSGPFDSHFLIIVIVLPLLLAILEVGALLRWLLAFANLSAPSHGVGAATIFLIAAASFLFMTLLSSVAAGFEAYYGQMRKAHGQTAPLEYSPVAAPADSDQETKKDR